MTSDTTSGLWGNPKLPLCENISRMVGPRDKIHNIALSRYHPRNIYELEVALWATSGFRRSYERYTEYGYFQLSFQGAEGVAMTNRCFLLRTRGFRYSADIKFFWIIMGYTQSLFSSTLQFWLRSVPTKGSYASQSPLHFYQWRLCISQRRHQGVSDQFRLTYVNIS